MIYTTMGFRFTKEDFDRMLADGNYTERPDLKYGPTDMFTYYQLSDGRILLIGQYEFGDGNIFPSEQALKDLYKTVLAEKPHHILQGMITEEEAYPEYVNMYKVILARELKIEKQWLDFTFASLNLIDTQIKVLQLTLDAYLNKIAEPLIAYMGETIRKERGGNWVMKYDDEYAQWEPYIELKTGKLVNIFIDLIEDASEDFANFTVYGTSQLRLDTL
jgi:hypothetical protein